MLPKDDVWKRFHETEVNYKLASVLKIQIQFFVDPVRGVCPSVVLSETMCRVYTHPTHTHPFRIIQICQM